MQIYSCYHKPYQTIKSDIIIPIHVGKISSEINLGFVGDNTGNNISSKNPYFCELTATYWIWKNVTANIVGLFHYRRFLNFNNDETKIHSINKNIANQYGITKENIKNLLKKYDIIVPKKTNPIKINVYDYYQKKHIASDMDCVLSTIKKIYPQQYPIALKTLKDGSSMFVANMLIAKKNVFDAYAQWLFSILFDVEIQIQSDVLKRDSYQQRVYGFLAERLMGVFLATHPELKVKQLPMLFVEEDSKKWRKYRFRQITKKTLTLITLGKIKWKK